MVKSKRDGTVHLHEDLLDRIDGFIEANSWGYTSRPQVVEDAVRQFLKDDDNRPENQVIARPRDRLN